MNLSFSSLGRYLNTSNPEATAIQDMLNGKGAVVDFDASNFTTTGEHAIQLMTTNWLQESDTATFVIVKENRLVLSISSNFPSVIEISRTRITKINVGIRLPGCAGASGVITFDVSWSQLFPGRSSWPTHLAQRYSSQLSPNVVQLKFNRTFTPQIPEYTLEMGHTYAFNMLSTVFVDGTDVGSTNHTVIVTARVEYPIPRIQQGVEITVPVVPNQSYLVDLSGSQSIDPKNNPGSFNSGLYYEWRLNNAVGNFIQNLGMGANASDIALDTSTLSANTTYNVWLSVRGVPVNGITRERSSRIQIHTTDRDVAVISLLSTGNVRYRSDGTKVFLVRSRTRILSTIANIDQSRIASYSWSCGTNNFQ